MVINHRGAGRLPKIVLALVIRDTHECEGEHTSHSFAWTTISNTWLVWKMSCILHELMKYLCIPLYILGVINGGISLLSMKLIRNGLVGFNGLSVEPVVVM